MDSIDEANDRISFFCDVVTGEKLYLIRRQSLEATLSRDFKAFSQGKPEPIGGILNDCLMRRLAFPEQRRVFSMIPALREAEFVRYGVMHRNTYLQSPGKLDRYYRLIAEPRIRSSPPRSLRTR